MRCDGRRHRVTSELQFECDGPCGDDGQARGLAPMHHAVVKDKWRLSVEGSEESGRSHGRSTLCMIRTRVHGGCRSNQERKAMTSSIE